MKVMSKRCLQIITALLCVLLLAGCGAKAGDKQTAESSEARQTVGVFGVPGDSPDENGYYWTGRKWVRLPDGPAPTRRGSLTPKLAFNIGWGESAETDDGILDTAGAYFTLLATSLAVPEKPVQSDPCCTDALVQEAYMRGFMASCWAYHSIDLSVQLNNLTFPTADTARVEARVTYNVRYSSDVSGQEAQIAPLNVMGWGNEQVLTLGRTDGRWIVTGDESNETDLFRYACGYATENPPEEDIRQAVEGYFQLRAGEVSGDMKNSDVTVSPLLNDAKEFASQWRKTFTGTVCGVESRIVHYSPVRDASCVSQVQVLQVKEVLRVDSVRPDKTVGCDMLYIDHTLTLEYDGFNMRYVVVGDQYCQYINPDTHICSILEPSIN